MYTIHLKMVLKALFYKFINPNNFQTEISLLSLLRFPWPKKFMIKNTVTPEHIGLVF